MCSDLDAIVDTCPGNVSMAPACPVFMDKLLQPDDMDRALGEVKALLKSVFREVKATTYQLDPCPPWL